jgi:HEAT repeat protein
MRARGDDHLESGIDPPQNARRFQTNVRTLVALVACCGVILWAARRLWENYDPVRIEVRSIQNRAIAALRSGKSADRVDAVHELQRLSGGDRAVAISSLIGALEDPETEVRVAAAEALGSIGPTAMRSQSGQEEGARNAATALIGALEDPETEVRVAAAEALGSIGSTAMRSQSGQEEGARNAATALVRCLNDPQPGVRTAAATSLGLILWPPGPVALKSAIDRQAVMDALASVLRDRDARVRLTAIKALVSRDSGTGPPKALLSALDDESAENRATAIRSLWFYGQGLNPFVPALLRVASKDPDPSVQGEIFSLWARKRLRPPAVTADVVPCLVASLQSGDRKVRRLAAQLLPEFRAAANEAIPELLRVLNEPLQPGVATTSGETGDPDPAIHAAFALGYIGPGSAEAKQVIAALVEVARNGPRSRRAWAASELGGFGTDAAEAAPVLTQLIQQTVPDEEWRPVLLAEALAKITADTPSARQAVVALVGLLESNEMRVRVPVLRAMGEFGPNAAVAIPRIRTLKNDPALSVREAAAAALARIEDQSAPE